MICEETVKVFCNEDITKIENYDKAIADTTKTWQCHHRLEIMPFSKKEISVKKMEELGLYYNRPANELIFLTETEHKALHLASRNKSKPTIKKDTHFTEEQKKKLYATRQNRCWVTNGVKNKWIRKDEPIPNGYFPGFVTEKTRLK